MSTPRAKLGRRRGGGARHRAPSKRPNVILLDIAPHALAPIIEAWTLEHRARTFSFEPSAHHVCWSIAVREATQSANISDGLVNQGHSLPGTKEHNSPIVCVHAFFRLYGCTECGRLHQCNGRTNECMAVFNEHQGSYVCSFSGLEVDRETVLGSFDAEVRFAAISTDMNAHSGTSIADMIRLGSKHIATSTINIARADRQRNRQKKRTRDAMRSVPLKQAGEEDEEGEGTSAAKCARLDKGAAEEEEEEAEDGEDGEEAEEEEEESEEATVPAYTPTYGGGSSTEEEAGLAVAPLTARAQVMAELDAMDIDGAAASVITAAAGAEDASISTTLAEEEEEGPVPVPESTAHASSWLDLTDDRRRRRAGPIMRMADIGRAGLVDEAVLEDDMDDREGDTQRFRGLSSDSVARMNSSIMRRVHNMPSIRDYVTEVHRLERANDSRLVAWAREANSQADSGPKTPRGHRRPYVMSAHEKECFQRAQRIARATYRYDPLSAVEAAVRAFDDKFKAPLEAEKEGSAWVQTFLQVAEQPDTTGTTASVAAASAAAAATAAATPPHQQSRVVTRKRYRRTVFQCMKRIQKDVATIMEYLARMNEGTSDALSREALSAKITAYTQLALKLFRFMLTIDPLQTPIRQRRIGVVLMLAMLPNYFYQFDYFAPRVMGEQNKILIWAPDPWLYAMKQKGYLTALVGDSKRTMVSQHHGISMTATAAASSSSLPPLFHQTDLTTWHNGTQDFFRDAHITAQALRNAIY